MANYGNVKVGYVDHRVIGNEFDSFANLMKDWGGRQDMVDNHLVFYHVRLSGVAETAISDLAKQSDLLALSMHDESTAYMYKYHYVSSGGHWFKICEELNMDAGKQNPDGTERSIKDAVDEFYGFGANDKTITELEEVNRKINDEADLF